VAWSNLSNAPRLRYELLGQDDDLESSITASCACSVELLCDILPWGRRRRLRLLPVRQGRPRAAPSAAMSRALLSTSSAEPTANRAAERAGKQTRACR
jgi:hypothetical protein